MSAFRLAYRYAKSLKDLAIQKNQLEEVNKDIRRIHAALKSNRDLILMLRNPIIQADRKQKVIDKIFSNLNPITEAFIRLTVNKRREEHLPEFTQSFIEQYNKVKNITPVKVTTAVPMDNAMLTQISELLKKDTEVGTVEMHNTVDENIIGGFVLHYGDKLFDSSVSRALNIIDDDFADNEYVKKF